MFEISYTNGLMGATIQPDGFFYRQGFRPPPSLTGSARNLGAAVPRRRASRLAASGDLVGTHRSMLTGRQVRGVQQGDSAQVVAAGELGLLVLHDGL